MSVVHVPPDVTVLAMDVHKNTISTGLLEPGSRRVLVDKISTDDESIRRLIARFENPREVWACYEAGPTGYGLARVLRGVGMRCEVIAPSLIPTRQGDRVKTDARDARRLAELFRGGQLLDGQEPPYSTSTARLDKPFHISALATNVRTPQRSLVTALARGVVSIFPGNLDDELACLAA